MPTLQFATLTPQCLLCLAVWYNLSSVLGAADNYLVSSQ